MAEARGIKPKHAIKQVDRLLSNRGIDVWALFAQWVPFVLGDRKQMVVAMDWTDHDHDDQTTIAINLITAHGRATPLIWKTVLKSKLADHRNTFEDEVIVRLRQVLPEDVLVTILADRGFGDQKLYAMLEEFGFKFSFASGKTSRSPTATGKPGLQQNGFHRMVEPECCAMLRSRPTKRRSLRSFS